MRKKWALILQLFSYFSEIHVQTFCYLDNLLYEGLDGGSSKSVVNQILTINH